MFEVYGSLTVADFVVLLTEKNGSDLFSLVFHFRNERIQLGTEKIEIYYERMVVSGIVYGMTMNVYASFILLPRSLLVCRLPCFVLIGENGLTLYIWTCICH